MAIMPEHRTLTMTNRSDLPLTFTLRTQQPFSLDSWEYTLKPGDACNVKVRFPIIAWIT